MTAKEYLNQARWLDQQIQAKLLRYEQMRVLVEKCTASSGTGGGGSRDVHSLEKSICKLIDFGRELDEEIDLLILGSIAKSTILQYRQFIAGGGFATKSRRSYCPRKADGFAAAFSGIANNSVVCNRGQYITKRKEIDNVIQSVPDYKQRMVLEYRYQCSLPFSAIAKKLHVSERYAQILHDNALLFVQNYLDCTNSTNK